MCLLAGCVGGYQSLVVAPEAWLARIPEGMSFEDAAAMPLAALTAWQVLLGSHAAAPRGQGARQRIYTF